MVSLFPLMYPELRELPSHARVRALRRARREPLDVIELLGIAAGLIVSMLVVRYGLPAFGVEQPLALAAASACVFALTIGPFLLRRTRRALRAMR